MGTQPVNREIADFRGQISDFCREIETYLCRKNDGHLIRVVGPSFDCVASWARRGVPLKIAFAGIDRYFERYYRQGPRRRPVKIDFCEADVLDVFDEWRRAVGISRPAAGSDSGQVAGGRETGQSLPRHLERVLAMLTSGRAQGALAVEFDPLIDRVASELDRARAKPGGMRGTERAALVSRLSDLDADLVSAARRAIDATLLESMEREADADLDSFRSGMTADSFERARHAAVVHLIRQHFRLPTVSYAD